MNHREVCTLMNWLVANDPEAITALVNYRVPTNQKVIDHPSIQVHHTNTLGLLGVLNGILVNPVLVVHFEDVIKIEGEPGKILGFSLRDLNNES